MVIDPREVLAVFLAEVRENPDDDTPRLVLADWLQDQDDPRGELIALGLQRRRLPTEDPRQDDLKQQELRLLRRHAFEWLGELIDVASYWRFQRGFLHIEARADRLLTDEVAAQACGGAFLWVESLRLSEVTRGNIGRLSRSPILGAISCLDLSENALGDQGVVTLLQSEGLPALRRLALRGARLRARGAYALARCPHLQALQRLDLRRNDLPFAAITSLQERFGKRVLFGGLNSAS